MVMMQLEPTCLAPMGELRLRASGSLQVAQATRQTSHPHRRCTVPARRNLRRPTPRPGLIGQGARPDVAGLVPRRMSGHAPESRVRVP